MTTGLEGLGHVSELVEKMMLAKADMERLETDLALAKETYDGYAERMLPDALNALGITQIKTSDGRMLTVKKEYYAKIAEKHTGNAYEWLKEHGHAAIMRDTVSISVANEAAADEAEQNLYAMGLDVDRKKTVHPSTLKAFVKEQIEAGTDIPRDVFGVYETWKTTVK
jgi:cell division septum initiation protein DivIVA